MLVDVHYRSPEERSFPVAAFTYTGLWAISLALLGSWAQTLESIAMARAELNKVLSFEFTA